MNFYLNHVFEDVWTMYEFLFEPCILRCLNYVWKKNFIRFYNPSLFCIFRAVSKMCFWQPWLCPFTLTLFMVFITYEYTDGMCLSIYSRDHGNYSPWPWHCSLFTYGYIDEMCLSVYSRDHRNCSPSPWHCSRCSLHMSIPMECVCWYILETIETVPLHPSTNHGVHYIGVYRRNVFVGIF
jgi:hypothetical protein